MSSWYTPSKPEEIKPIPWLHPDAIEYLDNLLRPDFLVIEHGSGGSTLWLAKRVKHIVAFEKNNDWYREVKKQASVNVTIISGPMQKSKLVPKMEMLTGFDLVLIDGEPVEDRAVWLKAVPSLLKPGGYVVLDNSNRPEYAQAREEFSKCAKLLKCIDGNSSGTKYLVTEFWQAQHA